MPKARKSTAAKRRMPPLRERIVIYSLDGRKAFHNPPGGGRIGRGLIGLKSFTVVTTYNAPWWFIRLYMGEPGKKVLMRGFKRLIAPNARNRFLVHYDLLRSTEASRKRFLDRVEAVIGAI